MYNFGGQSVCSLRGFFLWGAVGKNQDVPGVLAAKVAGGAHVAQVLPQKPPAFSWSPTGMGFGCMVPGPGGGGGLVCVSLAIPALPGCAWGNA